MLIVAMRGWLNDVRSYVPPVAIGEKMRGAALATVIHSRVPGIQSGDTVISPVRVSCLDLV
jgi:NADPH-dependent curcumin reductase CurA